MLCSYQIPIRYSTGRMELVDPREFWNCDRIIDEFQKSHATDTLFRYMVGK